MFKLHINGILLIKFVVITSYKFLHKHADICCVVLIISISIYNVYQVYYTCKDDDDLVMTILHSTFNDDA